MPFITSDNPNRLGEGNDMTLKEVVMTVTRHVVRDELLAANKLLAVATSLTASQRQEEVCRLAGLIETYNAERVVLARRVASAQTTLNQAREAYDAYVDSAPTEELYDCVVEVVLSNVTTVR
jgi:hypothetical protein